MSSGPHLVLRSYALLELYLPNPNPHFFLFSLKRGWTFLHRFALGNFRGLMQITFTLSFQKPQYIGANPYNYIILKPDGLWIFFFIVAIILLSSNNLYVWFLSKGLFSTAHTVHSGLPRRFSRAFEMLTKCSSNIE